MTVDTSAPRSRRTVLTAAVGGGIAAMTAALSRPAAVRGGVDGDVVLGSAANSDADTTKITCTTAGYSAFWGASSPGTGAGVGVRGNAASPNGIGVWGEATASGATGVKGTSPGAGVWGESPSGYGVAGISDNGEGVHAEGGTHGVSASSSGGIGVAAGSNSSYGVYAFSLAADRPGVLGFSSGNSTGLYGHSGSTSPSPSGKAKTGVYGFAGQDSTSKGVFGESPAGRGIHGKTASGYAGYFEGKVLTTKFYELTEITTPGAPGSSRARLYLVDTGSSQQLRVRFGNGVVKTLATSS